MPYTLSPQQQIALTRIEEACMWANAAIARNEIELPKRE